MRSKIAMDDSTLIAGCREGMDEAFEALVNKYQSSLLTLTWSLLGNEEDARDAAQGAFLSAFTHLDSFDSGREFKPWLFAIAWKDCLDMKRKEKIRRVNLGKASEMPISAENRPATASRIEESEIFKPALKRLDQKERAALCLRINEGFTSAEIAAVLGCAESSARVYISKAIRKIRKAWDGGMFHV